MKASSRENRFRTLLWSAVLLPVLLAAAIAVALGHLVSHLLDDAQWVDHTDQVIAQAHRAKENGLSLQSTWLRYQLRSQTNAAENFAQNLKTLQSDFDSLAFLVRDNPAQEQRLAGIRAAFNQWSELATRAFSDPTAAVGPSAPQKELFRQFTHGMDGFVAVEQNLRALRTHTMERSNLSLRRWRLPLLVFAGALVGLLWVRQLLAIAGLFRASEAAAVERAEILETTLASIGEAVVATDAQGRVSFLNRIAAQLTGWTAEQARGRPLEQVLQLYDEETHQPLPEPWTRALKEGQAVELPARTLLRGCNEAERCIAGSAAPIRQGSGHPLGLVVVLRDVNEERQTQRMQARLAAIVRSSEDAIIGKDLQGIMNAWNEGAERLFGYSAQEALGKPITLIYPPERHQEEPAILEAIRHGQRIEHYETVRLTKAGRRVEVSTSVSPILDERHRVVGASSILRDISRLKAQQVALEQAQEELEQRVGERTLELTAANAQLQKLDRYRSEFLAAMSHELRTPLNSIIGFTEILKEGRAGPLSAKQTQYLSIALGSAKHLLTLINDLLDLSRIEAGKEQVYLEPFDLQAVVHSAVQTIQTAAQDKALRLEADVAVPGPIESDRKKVYQIILNLLNNAVKFTDAGLVRLEARTRDGELQVSVSDTGIGMSPDQVSALFEQFRRVEKPGRRFYEGAGLGLYLCKKLVTLLGGEIWVESERGKGSRFTFQIPIHSKSLLHAKAQNLAH